MATRRFRGKVSTQNCVRDSVCSEASFGRQKWLQRDSGERYPPRPVYGIVCALKRHLGDKNGDKEIQGKGINPELCTG